MQFAFRWNSRLGRSLSLAVRRGLLIIVVWAAAGTLLIASEPVLFNRDIRPILSDNCFSCHGPSSASREANLRLDQRESAVDVGAIVPGNVKDSKLLQRINSSDPDEQMPPPHTRKTLTDQQREQLKQWIESGAVYEAHWSLLPVPQSVAIPATAHSDWGRNEVDRFVMRQLQAHQWQPAVEATREQWLRRVTFDLTGLPPSLAEIDAFLQDQSSEAYEVVVDRLLHSPAYGERMANDWLDVARYADTFGYQSDRDTHLWPWRDWVIRAFNQNLSYRDFIVWQVAGDMLQNPTTDQILATAFNRLHRQTNEGGSIEEEFRVEYVADRVRTMGTAFLGLTLECARCHDHKYDPISQREYYQLTAFFNNIDEHGLYSHFTEATPTPALSLYEGDQELRHRQLQSAIAAQESELRQLETGLNADDSITVHGMDLKPPQPAAEFLFDDFQVSGDYAAVSGRTGGAIQFGGDDAFSCGDAGAFQRTDPFSLSLWVKTQEHAPRMIVAHRSRAAEDSAFRGYSLVLDSGHPTFSLVHFWPGNALQLRSRTAIALNEWVHLAVTYDGSSRAAGLRLFVNGEATPSDVIRDVLTRDIDHRSEWGDYEAGSVKLALGARFRDVGFKGGAVDDFLVFDQELSPLEVRLLHGDNAAAVLHATALDELRRHVALRLSPEAAHLRAELRKLRKEEDALVSQVRQIMVMREQIQPRATYLLARGDYTARTEQVFPDTPAGIHPMAASMPRNRMGFANWLVDDSHPLTSRVAVNRIWQIFFGRGIVASSEDFGSQGSVPTHPDLLDWLARDFMNHDWDVHHLIRQIVLSATYRQSSIPGDPEIYSVDPDNRYLSHGPRHRLSSEQLRDNALTVSGLLVRHAGGTSVFPYQPPGLWEESGTGKKYTQSTGDGLYRRSLYSFWRRTSPPPRMTTFDAPSREFCLARRERTTTPLQALLLLNDVQFIEAARVLAERLLIQYPEDRQSRLIDAFRLLTSRRPTNEELTIIAGMYNSQLEAFANRSEQATAYVTTGAAPGNSHLDVHHHAALTAVIQALMNFDECVTKR